MCENLVIVSTIEDVKKRYNVKSDESCLAVQSPSILSGGDLAWVITSKDPRTVKSMKFGFTSHRSEIRTDTLNVKTEDVNNQDKDNEYDRLMGIFMKPHLSEPISSFRCVAMVDAFLVTTPEDETYLIHMQNQERLFALAGIFDHWQDPKSGAYSTGFTIITAEANPMLRRIGIENMPVIINQRKVFDWLDLRLRKVNVMAYLQTYPDETMNGYPVSSRIFSAQLSRQNLNPIGQKLKPDQAKLPK